jgi:hypothetical protein
MSLISFIWERLCSCEVLGGTERKWRDLGRIAAVLVTLAMSGWIGTACGSRDSQPQTVDRFDAGRAWRLVGMQVAFGQRPAGSPQLRGLAARLRPLLPAGRFEAIPGEPRLRNIVGTIPGRRPGIVVGAHYDTLSRPRGFLGANNGAAGAAVVLEAARVLTGLPARDGAREVRFVLFDGEEPPAGRPEEVDDFYGEGLRGSRAYVAAHGGRTAQMILLDYVGNRGLKLPREASSTEWLWRELLAAAAAVGVENVFSEEVGPEILDDHTPFLRAGVPAVDLIDWRYPGHSLADGMERLSPRSLDAVGEAVVHLVMGLRR